MPSFCRVVLMGHLTRDPELRYAPSGTPIANLSVATNRRFKQGDDLKEETNFFDVVAFGKTAELVAQYLTKGDCAQFDGRLQQRRWQTDAGETRSKVEVVSESVTFIKTKRIGQEEPASEASTYA